MRERFIYGSVNIGDKIKVGIIGLGNVGKKVYYGVKQESDMELVGIFLREEDIPRHSKEVPEARDIMYTIDHLQNFKQILDVVLICAPSRFVPDLTYDVLRMGVNTVDAFDIHDKILEYRENADKIAKENSKVAVIGTGWDPGTDSVIRLLMEVMAPYGITFTNFGPGVSMGHSTAVRSFDGVADAVSYTIPKGNGLHLRLVYVLLNEGADPKSIEQRIKQDPYFIHDETHVIFVSSREEIERVKIEGHGVLIERYGKTINSPNQFFRFGMRIDNPAVTAQIMLGATRASLKLPPGAYTLIEIPPVYLMPGKAEDVIKRLY